MKLSTPLLLLTASVLLTGCSSLSGLFGGGTDEGAPHAGTGASAPERGNDGRYFDPAKNEWVQVQAEGTGRAPGAPGVSSTVQRPTATPPPPPPARASGVYNPSTGQIEWNSDPSVAGAAPAPTPRRPRWWWPF